MKRLIFITLLFPLIVFAQSKQDTTIYSKINALENQLRELEKNYYEEKIKFLEEQISFQKNSTEQAFNTISTQLDASTYWVSIVSVILALIAIAIGIFINKKEKQVVQIKGEVEQLLRETKIVKESVVQINDDINHNLSNLYKKLRREETQTILNRLLQVPQDISNLGQQLVSRELEKEDFDTLKKAYLKVKELSVKQKDIKYIAGYLALFFQHFLDLSIKDESIGNDILNDDFFHFLECSFENDVKKSTEDFMTTIINLGYNNKSKEINAFIKGLSVSETYKNSDFIYKIIFEKLQHRTNQFEFFSIISDEKESRIGKSNYGKFLIDAYLDRELNEKENAIIEEINSIIAELEKQKQ